MTVHDAVDISRELFLELQWGSPKPHNHLLDQIFLGVFPNVFSTVFTALSTLKNNRSCCVKLLSTTCAKPISSF